VCLSSLLWRHAAGDWCETPAPIARRNRAALASGAASPEIVSHFRTPLSTVEVHTRHNPHTGCPQTTVSLGPIAR
jgi:hypothetical protein